MKLSTKEVTCAPADNCFGHYRSCAEVGVVLKKLCPQKFYIDNPIEYFFLDVEVWF
jgi:hypothetical protein